MNKYFKKDKQVVKAFLDKAGIIYDDLFEPTVEPPDVIAKIEGKNIGLELTEFLIDEYKRVDGEFEIIFQRVKERLIEAGISNLVIRIDLEKINPEMNKRIFRDKCINAIVETCINKYDEIENHRTLIITQPVREIKTIVAFRIEEKELIITFDSRKRTFGSLKEKELKRKIEHKINCLNKSKIKSPDKHEGVDVYWLLMTIKGTFYSNYVGVDNEMVTIDLNNSYDRMFVFHERDKWFEEIKTVHSKMYYS